MASCTAADSGVERVIVSMAVAWPLAGAALALGPTTPDLGLATSDATTQTLTFAGIVFLVILLLGLGARRWLERRGDGRSAWDAEAGVPEPTRAVQGSVLRFWVPTAPGRVPLPGRLEVLRGDTKVEEIHLFAARGQAYPEVTFGRVVGAPLCHVQIEEPDVAGRQAKLSFLEGRWLLANLARPPRRATVYRGAPLAVEEQVALGNGDEVEIGPVTFVFRA